MKTIKLKSLRIIALVVFLLIMATALLFMVITYYAAEKYHLATTQLLNREVATHIVRFTSPFNSEGIDKKVADSIFHHAMVLSPSIEVYFLDTSGKVMSYYGKDGEILSDEVPLEPVHKLIASGGKAFVRGKDPRDLSEEKIFSAAEVKSEGKNIGFIYVILDSKEFREANKTLYNDHIGALLIKVFLFVLVASLLVTWLYLKRVERRFGRMIAVLERFRDGDYSARFNPEKNSEYAVLTDAFNRMANLLEQNVQKLTRSEEERKQLVANISHDLRTPLSVIRGYTETLLIKGEEKKEEYAQLIIQHIVQVENMVVQLFELARIDSAEIVPQKQPFLFSDIVLETVHSLSLTATQKGIKIDCEKCADNSWINADIKMMESVVQNIILNAIRHTPENNSIVITTEHSPGSLIFRVRNPGEKFDADLLGWLNDSSEAYRKGSPKATIGLTIVKRIIHLHHYVLEAESADGWNAVTIRMDVFIS